MKVLMLSAYDKPDKFQTRTFDNAKELTKFGHDVTVFTNSFCHFSKTERLRPKEKYRVENINGVNTVWMKTPAYKGSGISRGFNMLCSFFISIVLSKKIINECDVVLGTSSPPLTSIAAYIISRKFGAAYVHEIRDVWPDSLVLLGSISRFNPIYLVFKWMERFTFRNANKISTVVPFALEHIEKNGGNKNNASYIPTGISFDNLKAPQPIAIRENEINVFYIGGLAKVHDILSIIQASEILQEQDINLFKFTFIGYGEEKEFYKNLVNSKKDKNISFLPPVDKSQVISTARKADVLIHSIVYTPLTKWGSNPTKLYDYMSAGRPVICSFNSPNLPVKDADCGYSIEAGSPQKIVQSLIKFSKLNAEERHLMGLRGYNFAKENFSLNQVARRLEDLMLEEISELKQS